MADLVRTIKAKTLKESLSDEEVAKAILKVMVKSKKWQEHAKQHQNAELVILATPGLNTHFEKKDEKNLPSLLNQFSERQQLRFSQETKDVKKPEPFVYGPAGKVLGKFSYGPQGVGDSLFSYSSLKGNFSYSNTPAGEQMVIAGCPCGMIMQVAASNGKISEEHIQSHKSGAVYQPGKSMSNIYGPLNAGAAGYGSNVGYNNTPAPAYGKGFLSKEKDHGTGF